MPSTHSAAGDLVIVGSPAMAKTIQREPGRGLQVTAALRGGLQPTGR